MKALVSRVAVSCALVVLSFGAASAQDKKPAAADKYVISAKAGGVNFVEGSTTVERKNGKSGLLVKGDNLEVGDRVSTAADGKTEILLNPGSYLRVGGDSAFEFAATSLDDLKINLTRGSAIFEVFADEEFRVAVATPKSDFHLIRSGIYRVDVDADGKGSIEVWKGRAQVGESEDNIVKSGREANLENGTLAVAKFDRDNKDEFELWSRGRAKELAKVVSRLQRRTLRTALMNSYMGRGWNMYDSFGLWVYDPFGRNYCFLPFGWGWRSPYGYGFGGYIGGYNLPPVVYNPPVRSGGTTPTGGTQTPTGSAPGRVGKPGAPPTEDSPRRSEQRREVPAFIRVQGSGGTGGGTPVFVPDSGSRGVQQPVGPAAAPTANPARSNPSSSPGRGDSPQRVPKGSQRPVID